MNKKGKLVKFMSLTLAVAVVLGSVVVYNQRSKADEAQSEIKVEKMENLYYENQLPQIGSVVTKYEEEGVKYTLTQYVDGDTEYAQIIDLEEKTRKDLIFTENKSKLEVREYRRVESESESKIYQKTKDVFLDFEQIEKEAEQKAKDDTINVTRYKWGKRTYDKWGCDLWYSEGVSGYGNDYLRIGCKATYRIPIYKLDSERKRKCEEYISNIDSCNRNMEKALAIEGIGGTAAIVTAAETGGIGAIIAMLGTGATMTPYIIDAYHDYHNAVNLYNKIKKYGECE